jgi:hypothetical protein
VGPGCFIGVKGVSNGLKEGWKKRAMTNVVARFRNLLPGPRT